jgi:hypothetical protein
MTDRDDDQQPPEPRNRAERRRQEFGPGGRDLGAVPTDEPGAPSEAVVQTTNQGTLKLTGAGTGGATETDSRQPHHEGVHQPSRPNG